MAVGRRSPNVFIIWVVPTPPDRYIHSAVHLLGSVRSIPYRNQPGHTMCCSRTPSKDHLSGTRGTECSPHHVVNDHSVSRIGMSAWPVGATGMSDETEQRLHRLIDRCGGIFIPYSSRTRRDEHYTGGRSEANQIAETKRDCAAISEASIPQYPTGPRQFSVAIMTTPSVM